MTQLRSVAIAAGSRVSPQLFQSLGLNGGCEAQPRGATFAASIVLHSTLAVALAVLPILLGSPLPSVGAGPILDGSILEIRVLPPPPAAQAGGTKVARVPRAVTHLDSFVAPIHVSSEIPPDDIFAELDGDKDGVPGGVPGLRHEGNDVGSVPFVPDTAPPAPPRVVRISQIAAPQPVLRVPPRYPKLAADIGLSGIVVIEAEVDTSGHVRSARVLSGHKLLNEAALEAVNRWRYRPLLLNGEPTGFILNVQVEFSIRRS